MLRWDGVRVCKQDFELRHPQDLIRIPTDNPSTPWSRPEPNDVFLTYNLVTQSSENILTESGDNLVWTQ